MLEEVRHARGHLAEPRECESRASRPGICLALIAGEQLKETGLKRLKPAFRSQFAVLNERLQDVVTNLADPLAVAAECAATAAVGGEGQAKRACPQHLER